MRKKACNHCAMNKVCNDLPGFCILVQMGAVVALVGFLGYLFVSQAIAG